ncbi:GGDEF domain-containing protein [Maritimibacter sp. 55A14]|uniref:GGDEF domain-containing protein n=1 Tax=Maritimibacter sp. 55A14 TaxID=2174844 RepID=UPI001E5744EB|nr:GGDEF domain-containing protein [Maritimibacter sp. 55A14]
MAANGTAGGATGAGPAPPGPLLPKGALDLLMPLHVWVGASGHIEHCGPTLRKLRPGQILTGARLLEVFEWRRPNTVRVLADLLAHDGEKVQLAFRDGPRDTLRGIVVALGDGQGAILNLSLGISVVEAVGRYGLTGTDFAPFDPTVEMLYLIEAQSAILAESRKLNKRLEGARIAAEKQAFTDTLTGLRNRRAMDHALERLADPHMSERFGLMHLDLDYFKEVNDTLGHAAGDHVLRQVARILLAETRRDDMVVRAGGDEFVLICRNCDDVAVLNRIAQRIIERLEEPILFEGRPCRVSASIGTTLSSNYAAQDASQMLSDADRALYASKDGGRARHTVFIRDAGLVELARDAGVRPVPPSPPRDAAAH